MAKCALFQALKKEKKGDSWGEKMRGRGCEKVAKKLQGGCEVVAFWLYWLYFADMLMID